MKEFRLTIIPDEQRFKWLKAYQVLARSFRELTFLGEVTPIKVEQCKKSGIRIVVSTLNSD